MALETKTAVKFEYRKDAAYVYVRPAAEEEVGQGVQFMFDRYEIEHLHRLVNNKDEEWKTLVGSD